MTTHTTNDGPAVTAQHGSRAAPRLHEACSNDLPGFIHCTQPSINPVSVALYEVSTLISKVVD